MDWERKIGTIKNPTRVGVGLGGFVRRKFFFSSDASFKSASPSPSRRMPPCAYGHRFKSDRAGGDGVGEAAIHRVPSVMPHAPVHGKRETSPTSPPPVFGYRSLPLRGNTAERRALTTAHSLPNIFRSVIALRFRGSSANSQSASPRETTRFQRCVLDPRMTRRTVTPPCTIYRSSRPSPSDSPPR